MFHVVIQKITMAQFFFETWCRLFQYLVQFKWTWKCCFRQKTTLLRLHPVEQRKPKFSSTKPRLWKKVSRDQDSIREPPACICGAQKNEKRKAVSCWLLIWRCYITYIYSLHQTTVRAHHHKMNQKKTTDSLTIIVYTSVVYKLTIVRSSHLRSSSQLYVKRFYQLPILLNRHVLVSMYISEGDNWILLHGDSACNTSLCELRRQRPCNNTNPVVSYSL